MRLRIGSGSGAMPNILYYLRSGSGAMPNILYYLRSGSGAMPNILYYLRSRSGAMPNVLYYLRSGPGALHRWFLLCKIINFETDFGLLWWTPFQLVVKSTCTQIKIIRDPAEWKSIWQLKISRVAI